METPFDIMEKIRNYGVGQRKLDDVMFLNDKAPSRLGVYDLDDENLCHEIINTKCSIPGCTFTAESLLEFEDHYNSSHRYACSQCKKMLPSPHLLDLHLQEIHDSFFAVMAERKPSYSCYIEDCKQKFMTTNERHEHCVKVHKLPNDFRFEQKVKNRKKGNKCNAAHLMDVDLKNVAKEKPKVEFSNNKQKTFPRYTGKKFTNNNENREKKDVDMEITVDELKESLPQ